jgi:hypothetical protein
MKTLTVRQRETGAAEGALPGTVQVEMPGVAHGGCFAESDANAHIL